MSACDLPRDPGGTLARVRAGDRAGGVAADMLRGLHWRLDEVVVTAVPSLDVGDETPGRRGSRKGGTA
ncbi:MAG TPA: hypothetical protein VMT16_03095 [Thermoanaerobaculia bacterium]|nr:hypothetical protein [Thermoanaerobaculia bacterium]